MPSILYLRLDASYDPLFDTASQLSDLLAVAQAIQTRLMLFQGEWWENLNEGTPMFQQILGYRRQTSAGQDLATSALVTRIMGTPYVTAVHNVQMSFNPTTRLYTFTATVYTSFGSRNHFRSYRSSTGVRRGNQPMSTYVAPIVTAAGLTIPGYPDILKDNLAQYQKIYGANQYVGVDSAIYQLISVVSLKMADTLSALQFVYNNQSPATAIGAGLDRIVKLNGIARLPFTYSTALLTLTGDANSTITNGAVEDAGGNIWTLPPMVVIGLSGTVQALATCQIPGNITAEPNTLSIISTPQPGWATVTNDVAAAPGTAVETDSQLRARQALSVALPSHTMLQGVTAAVAAVPGVTRYNIVENYTNLPDANGNPPHSITAVVEGAPDASVAQAIYDQRGLGVYTNGTTTVPVTDPNTGIELNINFYRPGYIPVFLTVNVHALGNFTSAMPGAIAQALTDYLNALQIGEQVTQSALVAAAMAVTPNIDEPTFSIYNLYLDTSASPTNTADIPVAFNQVAQGVLAYVIVNLV